MKKYFQKLLILPLLIITTSSIMAQSLELSLEQALHLASKGNRLLQMRGLEKRKAAEVVKEAKSYLLPTVGLQSSYTIYGERPVIFLRNETTTSKVNDVRFGGRFAFDGIVSASYPILNAATHSSIRIAGINEAITKEEMKNTEEELALNIGQLYLTIIYHKEEKHLLQQSLLRNQRALQDSRSLFLQGKNLKTDTLSNFISVQNLQATISALDNNIQVYSLQLKQLMGMEEAVQFVYTDGINTGSFQRLSLETGAGLSIAMDNRKDIKMHTLQIDETKEQLIGVQAAYKPQLSVVAQYQMQSQADNIRLKNYGLPRTSFAGVRLSIPLYSGNRLKYKTAQTELGIKQTELALAELKSKVEMELVSISANLQEAYNQWEIQQQSVDAAQVSYTMMNDRYRYGMGTRLELSDAELALTRAKLNKLQSVYNIKLLELQMKKTMGVLQLN
jgi:outer membrane protein